MGMGKVLSYMLKERHLLINMIESNYKYFSKFISEFDDI